MSWGLECQRGNYPERPWTEAERRWLRKFTMWCVIVALCFLGVTTFVVPVPSPDELGRITYVHKIRAWIAGQPQPTLETPIVRCVTCGQPVETHR